MTISSEGMTVWMAPVMATPRTTTKLAAASQPMDTRVTAAWLSARSGASSSSVALPATPITTE